MQLVLGPGKSVSNLHYMLCTISTLFILYLQLWCYVPKLHAIMLFVVRVRVRYRNRKAVCRTDLACFFDSRYHTSVAHPALEIQEELKMQEWFSSCVRHVNVMPHPHHPAMMYSLQLTCCTVLLMSHSFVFPFSHCDFVTNPENALLKNVIPNLRNAIGIIRPVKLYFPLTSSKKLLPDLPCIIQALPS